MSERTHDHYLKRELYELVQTDAEIFEFLQSGSLDGVWYWDISDPEHEWLSPRFKEVFGYADDEIPHTSAWWQANIFEEDLPEVLERANAHFEDPSVPYDQVVRYRHRDGSTVWIRCRGIAIRDEDGRPIRMLGAHTDVTALKEAEIALTEKNRELEALNRDLLRANRDLEQFAYAASHDLREPLRMMSSFSELLGVRYAEKLDETGQRHLSFIADGARRMQEMIDDMLEVARIGPESLQPVDSDIETLARVVTHDLNRVIKETGAKVEIGSLPVLRVDSGKFERVLRNLVSNSIKFARAGVPPEVRIYSTSSDEGWTISVADNGIGIAAEMQERVFDMFQRLHTRDQYEGNGIGLSLVRRIVDMHGGAVTVDSTPQVGSTFHVFLPHSVTQYRQPSVEASL